LEMERERMKDHRRMNAVTFHNIPHTVLTEMAKHLDSYGEANWETLAEWYGFLPVDIKVITFVCTTVTCILMC